jgi:hypothetical protein
MFFMSVAVTKKAAFPMIALGYRGRYGHPTLTS